MPSKRGVPFHQVSSGDNNARCIRGDPGIVSAIWATNINAAIRYLKFFDTAVTPDPSKDRPHFVCGIPGGGAAGAGGSIALPDGGLWFDNGISFAIVTGAADGDNTGVAAAEIVVSFIFHREMFE